MNPQQLHDFIIKTALQYMGGNYHSKESAFLLLATAAIESNCGEYIKQVKGPALGIWQMEPGTHNDIWAECDALKTELGQIIRNLAPVYSKVSDNDLIDAPKYACAMARLKYSMDPNPLPRLTGDNNTDSRAFYDYYKRVYNTEFGASTFDKWCKALAANHIWQVIL